MITVTIPCSYANCNRVLAVVSTPGPIVPVAGTPCSCGCERLLTTAAEFACGHREGHASPEERVAGDVEDRDRRHAGEARPHMDEDAWWSGFCCGVEWLEADVPGGMSGHCRAAFLDGWDKGRREAEAERLEFCERYDAETLALMMACDDLEARYTDADLADSNISRKAV